MAITAEQFRRLAMALPDVIEGAHQQHADFRHAGSVFATLPDGATGMVKVPPDTQRQLVAAPGGVFRPASGAWGRAGCTLLRLDGVEAAVARDALTAAWQFAAASAAARRGKK